MSYIYSIKILCGLGKHSHSFQPIALSLQPLVEKVDHFKNGWSMLFPNLDQALFSKDKFKGFHDLVIMMHRVIAIAILYII